MRDFDLNISQPDNGYSNFRVLGIGKPSAKQVQRQTKRKEFRKDLKDQWNEGGLKDKVKVIGKSVMRYNPVAAVTRTGVLAGMRLNIFALAVRVYPAFLTPQEAKAKRIRVDAIEPAKEAWEKISNTFKGIGGNPENLKQAILKGYNKPVLKWTKSAHQRTSSSFSGTAEHCYSCFVNTYPTGLPHGERLEDDYFNVTGVEESAAVISAGLPVLTAMLTYVNNTKASKNPYEPTVDNGLTADIIDVDKTAPQLNNKELTEIEKLALKEKQDGLPLDDGTQGERALKEAEKQNGGTVWGIPTPLFVGGVLVLAAGLGYLLYNKFVPKTT